MKQIPRRLLALLTVAGIPMLGLFWSVTAHATTPGPNGRIAFRSGSDIYTMEPNGEGMTQLTHAPANDRYPNWSPDGTQIVFRRVTPGGNFAIFTIHADGSNLVRLTPGDTGVNTQPVWAPPSTPNGILQIVFSSNRLNPACPSSSFDQCNFQLFIMHADGSNYADGSNVHQLTSPDSGLSYALPTVSVDGTIAFTSFQDGEYRIGTLNSKGEPTLLTPPGMQAVWPDWSPDGLKIAFSNNGCPGCPNSDIFVMNANGTGVTRLTHVRKSGNYIQPHWSPDGTMIVFTNNGNNGSQPGDIYTMDLATGTITNLTNSPTVNDETPAWGTAP